MIGGMVTSGSNSKTTVFSVDGSDTTISFNQPIKSYQIRCMLDGERLRWKNHTSDTGWVIFEGEIWSEALEKGILAEQANVLGYLSTVSGNTVNVQVRITW